MAQICFPFVLILILICMHKAHAQCSVKSLSTASGSKARNGPFCPGELIFEDNFDRFDLGYSK